MWPIFSQYYRRILIALCLIGVATIGHGQQLVYDLQQNWEYYSESYQGFLPVDEFDLTNKTISFKLSDTDFDQFYLTIIVSKKAALFYRSQLIATLEPGVSNFSIDSLKTAINDRQPYLAIFGEQLLPDLKTTVRAQPMPKSTQDQYQPIRYDNQFSNFFYVAITLLIAFFVLLKMQFPDLADQYLLFQRSFRLRTIDELIFKVQMLGYPNNLFISFMALMFSLEMLAFMYFYPGSVSIWGINPWQSGFYDLMLSWMVLTGFALVILIIKYALTLAMSSIFAIHVTIVHFASSLRFLLILGFMMLCVTFLQFVLVGVLPESIFWVIFIMSTSIMIIILYLKLTLVTSHTLLYIFIYLCATEIIPILFLIKLVSIEGI